MQEATISATAFITDVQAPTWIKFVAYYFAGSGVIANLIAIFIFGYLRGKKRK